MREARYPLAAARTQRDHARQQAELALRSARARLQEAEAALELARSAGDAHARRRSAALYDQPVRDPGHLLARSGAYAARLQVEAGRLALQRRAAQATVLDEARAVRLAELALTQAYAEREALERHHERFRESERKAADRAYELELEERTQRSQGHGARSEA